MLETISSVVWGLKVGTTRTDGITRMLDQYRFKVANQVERKNALELQRQVYENDHGYVPRDEFDHLIANYLIALNARNDIVGAFRVVGSEYRPFDLEQFVDLSRFISSDRAVALIGRLCIREQDRAVSANGLLPLGFLKLAYEFASVNRISDFVMYSFPRLRSFYKIALFEQLGVSFWHPGYKCQMDVMRFDVGAVRSGACAPSALGRLLTGGPWPNVDVVN